jgi:hypothetical protein
MKKVITEYRCPSCNERYSNIKDAEKCLGSDDKPTFKVGDIVEAKYGFGWHDGDKDWIINPEVDPRAKHGFDKERSWGFYYVITHISMENHRATYHLATKAMTGKNGYRGGRTYSSGHWTPKLIENPPKKIIDGSKSLIGLKFEHLL